MKMRIIPIIALVVLPLCAYFAATADSTTSHTPSPDRKPPRIHNPPPLHYVDAAHANVRVEIVTSSGPTLVYPDGAYRWIEGRRGERFSFRITNFNHFPVGVILSADGHSLTADGRANASHPAYVIAPRGTETVSVWREDLRGGRELIFTDVERSLAARKGDRRNIGVLGVLVWQLEDKHPPRPVPIEPGRRQKEGASGDSTKSEPSARGGIGVGTGDRVTDRAYLTDRYRRVRVMESIAIYYDDHDGLLRAGVNLHHHHPEIAPRDRRSADPFPGDGYRGVRIP